MLDGKAFGAEVVEIVRGHIDRATAPLLARIADLEGKLAQLPAGPAGPAGRDADPALIRTLVLDTVAALPPARDGRDGVGLAGAVIDRSGVLVLTLSDGSARELGPVVGRDGAPGPAGAKGDPGERGLDGADGRDGQPGPAGPAGPEGPPGADGERGEAGSPGPQGDRGADGATGRDGADGRDGLDGKDGLAGVAGRDGSDGVDGKDGLDGKDGAPGVTGKDGAAGTRGEHGERGADGRDGAPGADADPAAITAAVTAEVVRLLPQSVDRAVAALPPAERGERGEPGQCGEAGPAGKDGADGRDGVGLADAMIDRGNNLVVTMTDGRAKALGVVVGADGRDGEPGSAGAPGADGFGLDDFDVELAADGRTIIFRFVGQDETRAYELPVPAAIYRGVYEMGARYEAGDMVTQAGGVWHCNASTIEKPGEGSKVWTLAVKRGRDGKDFTPESA